MHHCTNCSSKVQGIDFDQSYIPVAHADSFRINIAITAMHRLTARILSVSNASHNTNVLISWRFCVGPPPYYLDWFEISYPNIPLSWDDGPFYIQFMNGIQGTKPSRRKCNQLLDTVVTILKYNKIAIDNSIYIKVFSDVTVSYLTVSTDDFINTNNYWRALDVGTKEKN